jgi:hypothetical protein
VPAKRVVKFKVGNVLKKQVEAIAPNIAPNDSAASAPDSIQSSQY